MGDICKVPALRFGEFSGEWEEKLLNHVAQINPRAKELPDEFVYIDLESVEKGLLVKKNKILKIGAPSRAQRLLVNQDILFQTVRPYQKNNYYFELGDNYVASTGYAQIRTNESSAFLYQKLHTDKFVNKVLLRCTGTSYPAINSTDLSKIKISIPSKPEQEKIASFLSAVDTKIEQLSTKTKLLQSYKKGIMQKIFSQELRFHPKGISSQAQGTDDNGSAFPEWVEKRLGDLPIIISDGNYGEQYPTSEDFKPNGVAFLRANNIKNLKIDDNDTKYISIEQHLILTSGHLKTNDILITTRGQLGNIALVDSKHEGSNINAQICLLRISDKNVLNHLYLLYILNFRNSKKQYKAFETGTALKQLPKGNLKKIKLKIPSLKEQIKIANFLSSIDAKIAQTQKELEQTKVFKKALLQKMFV